jgi:GNAT superfamily N-acetyltransferase
MAHTITPLLDHHRSAWFTLARGYKTFYQTTITDAELNTAWQRLLSQDGIHGWGAEIDGKLVGLTHFLFHTSTWTPTVCYLQDLFVAPEARGRGLARALIAAVAELARARQAQRLYWLTQDHNTTARALYDQVAQFKGFIRYDYPL